MTKAKSVEPIDGQITFDITIPQADIRQTYQTYLARYAQTAEIKGFRKGKAPIALVEQNVDSNRLYAQILDELFPKAYATKIDELQVKPIIDPQITPKEFEANKDWVFGVVTATKPPVDLGDYPKYLAAALKSYRAAQKSESAKATATKDQGDAELTIIFDTLLKEAKLALPPILIESEAKNQLSRLVSQLRQLKLTVEDFAKSQKKTQDELIAEYRKTAETNLKLELILDKLVELEQPTVSDEEIAKMQAPKDQQTYATYILQKQKVVDKLKLL